MTSDSFDARANLRLADQLAREGAHAEALSVYLAVARHYARAGYALRAVAICRQIVKIAQAFEPGSADAVAALRLQVEHLSKLGLHDESAEAERQLRQILRGAEPPN